jgi:hypothetical protein
VGLLLRLERCQVIANSKYNVIQETLFRYASFHPTLILYALLFDFLSLATNGEGLSLLYWQTVIAIGPVLGNLAIANLGIHWRISVARFLASREGLIAAKEISTITGNSPFVISFSAFDGRINYDELTR